MGLPMLPVLPTGSANVGTPILLEDVNRPPLFEAGPKGLVASLLLTEPEAAEELLTQEDS